MAERPLWPRRNWWLALLAILVLAGALRYPGYDFSLPYVDYIDEPNHNLAARMLVDFGTARSIGHDSYPPGIIMLNYVFIRLFHDPATPPSTVTGLVRLVAITASMGVVILLALLGFHCMGPPAGLISAGIWTITPSFVYFSRLAIPDIFVTFFTVLAIWLALTGTRFRRASWTTHATYALMLAIIFKYQAVFVAPDHFAGATMEWAFVSETCHREHGALCPIFRLVGVTHAIFTAARSQHTHQQLAPAYRC